jgi:hypothetical protein
MDLENIKSIINQLRDTIELNCNENKGEIHRIIDELEILIDNREEYEENGEEYEEGPIEISKIIIPQKIEEETLIKCLYLVLEYQNGVEFLIEANSDIEFNINQKLQDLTLLGTASMKRYCFSIMPLITYGANPFKTSLVVIDDRSIEPVEHYYEDKEQSNVYDILIIAQKCSFEIFGQVCDFIFSQPRNWKAQPLVKILHMWTLINIKSSRFRYFLDKLSQIGLLEGLLKELSKKEDFLENIYYDNKTDAEEYFETLFDYMFPLNAPLQLRQKSLFSSKTKWPLLYSSNDKTITLEDLINQDPQIAKIFNERTVFIK